MLYTACEETDTDEPAAPDASADVYTEGSLNQWHHEEMDTERAWGISTGKNVTIAIIDSGIDINHPAFAGRISAYSFNAHTNRVGIQYVMDDHSSSHGTHVAGIAAAAFDSVARISGVALDATILAVKSNIPENPNYYSAASWIRGLNYAVLSGAQVVNLSFGRDIVNGLSELEQSSILNAVSKGVTVIAAAGNDRGNHANYPAAYPEVIAVSATRQGYQFDSTYSNYGPEIDVSAPGTSIYSTISGGYGTLGGTSMAAPNVVGVAALVKALNPTYTPQQVRDTLCMTAQDAGALGPDNYYGYGIVSAYAAVLGPDALYDVTYDFRDGSSAPLTVKVAPGGVLIQPDPPNRIGNVFNGWFISGTNTVYNFASRVDGNLKLDARWLYENASTYTLSYDADGGEGAPPPVVTQADTDITVSGTIPVRPGYLCMGWVADRNIPWNTYQPGGTFRIGSSDVTLYAVWYRLTVSYTLSYDANGGSGAPPAQQVTALASTALSVTSPERTGYFFLGWVTDPGRAWPEYMPGDIINIGNGNKTLYAVWYKL
jgi:uncharacterized repeat protein (TIGR02543 family)